MDYMLWLKVQKNMFLVRKTPWARNLVIMYFCQQNAQTVFIMYTRTRIISNDFFRCVKCGINNSN